LTLAGLEIKQLSERDVTAHRWLSNAFPDIHLAVLLRAFPRFSEICRYFDPDPLYWHRQRLIIGAFSGGEIVGTVAIQKSKLQQIPEWSEADWERFFTQFSQQELNIYKTWNTSLSKTFIWAPENSLTMHSLSVAPPFRRTGLATHLIGLAIAELSQDEKRKLYVETARQRYLVKLFSKHRFKIVRKSFSISEKL
jgi:ribosomal protein S18 acetylase RimI-like enzyme